MNDDLTNKRLSPKHVITVFSDKNRHKYYLEQREVVNINGELTLMAPIPMSDNTFKQIAATYMEKNSFEMDFGGLVDPSILFAWNKPGKTIVIWYRPAMERSLNFSAQLHIPGAKMVQVPATLYAVVNNTLYAFALMDDERPVVHTKLYNAPYFNIYKDGNVCLGSANVGRHKAKTFQKEAQRFEDGFYAAEQNHGHIDKCCKTPLVKLWTSLMKRKAPFPSAKELLQHAKHKTLGDLIINITGKAYEE